MRIGIFAGSTPATSFDLKGLIAFAQDVEARGFESLWLPNIFGLDGVGACAIVGWETARIELGTAVTPSYPRHPAALAQQAITTQLACDGRFALGIGLSHKLDFAGDQLSAHLQLEITDTRVPLLVAALGPAMLKLAGQYTDGTSLWMTGAKTIAAHIVPLISAAAAEAGRPAPRIVCGMPICLTSDVPAAREHIASALQVYGMLPSYRAMLDREGVAGPADLALVGDEGVLRKELARLREAGVTDFNAAVVPAPGTGLEPTLDFLTSELR